MNFESLQQANESIVTTDIKGKDYAQVNQRIKVFRMLYPEGFIKTEIVSLKDGVCLMKAKVGYYTFQLAESTDELKIDEVILGTGTAYEKEDSSFINKTSYIENCETSAIGRALAMCGIGIDTSIASKEEVENAIENQKSKPSLSSLKAMFDTTLTVKQKEETLKHYGVKELKDLSDDQMKELSDALAKKAQKKAAAKTTA